MSIKNKIISDDLKHIWHPCSQMHDYATFKPLIIKSAFGPYIELDDGTKIIDAISSWWCKTLGHNHPQLKNALLQQLEKFEHVIFANTCNPTIVELSNKLTTLTKTLNKVFYASEGSSAVEIAIKMCVHAKQILGESERTKIMSLQNAYHGETGLALAASDCKIYRKPYAKILMPQLILNKIPYVNSKDDSLWQDCSIIWPNIEKQLEKHKKNLAAIIVEPIIQGAAGMLLYSKDFLAKLRHWTLKNSVYLIADEIMTGFGRTGKPFACMHANIEPDLLCLGKGLTAGWLPMSAVLLTDSIYNIFYANYSIGKSFLHSHTQSGNALAAAVALECLKIYENEKIYQKAQQLEITLLKLMQEVATKTKKIKNIRCIGAIVAADLDLNHEQQNERIGYKIFQEAIKLGAYLRPLGNTIYWLPPLNIDYEILVKLKNITIKAINNVLK